MSQPLLHTCFSAGYKGGAAVLHDVELNIEPGEILGLVGESGSGKSTVALALMRLLAYRNGWARGEVNWCGRDLLSLSEPEMRAIRGREVSLVMQSPMSALNPATTIGAQFRECARAHRGNAGSPPDLIALLEMVNLPTSYAFLERYPRQLSVGQAQRVLIAMAALHRPRLLIADEPTSALDAINQAGALQLFADLARYFEMSVLFISHDLLSVASLCGRIAILEHGSIVEEGSTRAIFSNPQHAYTRSLLAAIPRPAVLDDIRDDKPSLTEDNYDDRLSPGYQRQLTNLLISRL